MKKREFHATEPQDRWLCRYARRAAQPLAWESTAQHLKQSADLILHSILPSLEEAFPSSTERERLVNTFNLLSTYYLLAALALENLLKGILVAKKPELVTKEGWVGPLHNLSQSCKEAGIPLPPKQNRLIERLTGYIIFAGRYPMYKKQQHLFATVGDETPLTVGPIENEAIDELFADFQQRLFVHNREYNRKTGAVHVNSITFTPNGKVILKRGKS